MFDTQNVRVLPKKNADRITYSVHHASARRRKALAILSYKRGSTAVIQIIDRTTFCRLREKDDWRCTTSQINNAQLSTNEFTHTRTRTSTSTHTHTHTHILPPSL